MAPEFSVVIPVHNEEDNIGPLLQEILAACAGLKLREIVCVDDGSTDASAARIEAVATVEPRVRLLRHARRSGQSAALVTGARAASAPVVATLDGDGQNDPADLPRLYRAYVEALEKSASLAVLVAGQRLKRQDDWRKKIASRLANAIRAAWLNDATRDTGCGIKMFTRAAFLSLPAFNHMHRYLPALFGRIGAQIVHIEVGHRPRLRGVSKYGVIDRALAGLADLIGVKWLMMRMIRTETLPPSKE